MKRVVVLFVFSVFKTLLIVSTYTIVTATPPLGDVVAQSITTTRERIISRESQPAPPEVSIRQLPPPPREEGCMVPPSPAHGWVSGY
jgi:hypothetical protein